MNFVIFFVVAKLAVAVSGSGEEDLVYPPVDESCFKRAVQVFCSSHSAGSWNRCLKQLTKPGDLVYVNATNLCLASVTHLCIVDDFCPPPSSVQVSEMNWIVLIFVNLVLSAASIDAFRENKTIL